MRGYKKMVPYLLSLCSQRLSALKTAPKAEEAFKTHWCMVSGWLERVKS
jgi:hypothetical protein